MLLLWKTGTPCHTVRLDPCIYYVHGSDSIAVSRSIGNHKYTEAGMTCEPDICITDAKITGSHCVVLASDGIWDVWKYDDLSQFIGDRSRRGVSAQEICSQIVTESVRKSTIAFGRNACDDISIVMWFY